MANDQPITQIADPAERAIAARAAQVQLQATYEEERAALISITAEAVREMRKTMSLAKVAAVLGVTPGRVQQLEKA